MQATLNHWAAKIGGGRDFALALTVMAIIAMLILPMPGWLLDIGLALSITLSVMILMTALFIEKPLELSAFPTILLIATMLRLGLNLASTRLILGHGHEGPHAAGGVIAAFGEILIGGEPITGQSPHRVAVAGLGDVDGDLVDDFAVSSTLYEVNSAKVGAVFVVYGSNLLVSGKVEDFVTGSKGFRVAGPGDKTGFGTVLAGVGDFNKDGVGDVAVGQPNWGSQEGRAYVVFGQQPGKKEQLAAVPTASQGLALRGNLNDKLGLAVAGVPFAALLSAVMLMLCIAQLGPALVLFPAVGWMYWTGDNAWATFLLVWSLIVGSLDNFLRPMLIKRGADLPLLLIFAGVIGGMLSFGLIGIFVGPVVLAVTWTLMLAWIEDALGKDDPETSASELP